MQDPLKASALLKAYNIKPDKSLGQNFIVDQAALDKVVSAAGLGEVEQILEVGAGLGALTFALAGRGHRVVAIEYDQRLIPVLGELAAVFPNVQVVQGDILALDLAALLEPPSYVVVANIPYQITSAVIRKLVTAPYPARRVVLTIQREVAERIVASPGDLSLLALSVQVFGRPSIHAHLPAGVFYPRPRVDSSVLRVEMYPTPQIPVGDLDRFFRLAKAGFSQKRKKLRNALAAGLQLSTAQVESRMREAGIAPARRAQELSLDEWQQLSDSFPEAG